MPITPQLDLPPTIKTLVTPEGRNEQAWVKWFSDLWNLFFQSGGITNITAGSLTLTGTPVTPANGVLYAGDAAWHIFGNPGEPNYQNGWGAVGSGTISPRFRKDAEGWVNCAGSLNNAGTANATIIQFPVGCRPSAIVESQAAADGTPADSVGRLRVDSGGNLVVTAKAVGGSLIGLDNLRFYAEQ